MSGGVIRNTWHGFRAEASPHGEDAFLSIMQREITLHVNFAEQ